MLDRRGFLQLCGLVITSIVLEVAKLPVPPSAATSKTDPRRAVAIWEKVRQLFFDDEPLIDAPIARKLIRELNRPTFMPPSYAPLTEREAEVIILIARGLSKQEIAERLRISERSVSVHHKSLMHKTRYSLAFVINNAKSTPSHA